MAGSWLRLRAFLDRRFPVVVAVLLVFALLGGWATFSPALAGETTTETRQVTAGTTTGTFDHGATVTEENPVYPVGTELTNRSMYFTPISPHLDGSYAFRYTANGSGDLGVSVTLVVLLQGVETERDGTTVLWQTPVLEKQQRVDSLAPGETLRVPFSVDVNETANRSDVIEKELGNPPGTTRALVRATVDVEGRMAGRPVDRQTVHTLPVTLGSKTYRPARKGALTDRYTTGRTVTVHRQAWPSATFLGPAVLGGALLALAGLVTSRRLGWLAFSSMERERLVYEDHRKEFDEWISTVRLPETVFDRPRAEAASLEALVDVAIDTDSTVVRDPDEGAYFVLHDGHRYTYRPPEVSDAAPADGAPGGAGVDLDALDGEALATAGNGSAAEQAGNGADDESATNGS